MIKLNLKNAVSDSALKKYKDVIKQIAMKMENLNSEGFEYLGWKNWPTYYDKIEFSEMKKTAKLLQKEHVELLVVIGIGGSYAGAKAGIEMIQGLYPIDNKMEVIFAGESLSSTALAQKLKYAQNKNFAINVISKSGTTTEPAIAFRMFRKLLEEKVGLNNASRFIVATTDANNGALLKLARSNEYKTFVIPDNIGGRYSVLTPVGLFPMACVGIDIEKVMVGAKRAQIKYSSDSISLNDAYKYAAARHILTKRYPVELMVQYESQMSAFNEWWKQLAGESEGKNQLGVFPASAIFTTDLHSLGQFIQDGSKVLFETVLTSSTPKMDVNIMSQLKNIDNLNYLAGKTVSEINNVAFSATTDAHVKVGKVPNIHIEYSALDEDTFGQLVIFFQRAVAMTAYLQGVNPFNQPGVEIYKQNMFKQLGKPE